jgi:GNAT superfamily N-acetyltransferase
MQAAALEAEFAGMDAAYVCGALVWCWADHAWPQNALASCRRLGISPYGVMTRDRRPLPAFETARKLFRARQGLSPRTAPPPRPGRLIMIRDTLDDIPEAPLPAGFSIRPMRADESGLWTDIQRESDKLQPIPDDLFRQQFGSDTGATQWRTFFVVNPDGAAVGAVSAWYDRDFRGDDAGRIHWLAVRPAWRRRGLARAVLSFALKQLAQWHTRAYLTTGTDRLPAVKLYLDAGFRPDMSAPDAEKAWSKVPVTGPEHQIAENAS